MEHRGVWVLILVVTLAGSGCGGRKATGEAPWTHLDFRDDPRDFRFAIVGDRRGGSRDPEIFNRVVDRLNLLQPALVMSVGDLVSCCREDRAWGWGEFESMVDRLEMPFFHVAGNSDLSDEEGLRYWHRRFGRPYYDFVYRDVLFVVLSTEDPPGSPRGGHVAEISRDQQTWFADALERHRDVRWTFVFLHKPMWLHEQPEWLEMEARLTGRPHTVFGGHHHRYTRTERNGSVYYTLSSSGGAQPDTGLVFDHFMWVAMTRQGPRFSNLLLDGVWGDDPPDSVGVNASATP